MASHDKTPQQRWYLESELKKSRAEVVRLCQELDRERALTMKVANRQVEYQAVVDRLREALSSHHNPQSAARMCPICEAVASPDKPPEPDGLDGKGALNTWEF